MKRFNEYKPHFGNVSIFNLHQEGDIVCNFVCNQIPDALHTCNKLSSKPQSFPRENPSLPLDYDILAVHAYDQGLVRTDLGRLDVVKKVETYHVDILGRKPLPKICIDDKTKYKLREWFILSEKYLFHPDDKGWTDDVEMQLHLDFDSFAAKDKFCSVDAKAAVGTKEWQQFFEAL